MTSTNPPNIATSYTMLQTADNDATLIGTHCQYSYCNQLDFLPFRCESCIHTFCLEHRTESAHRCSRAGAWAERKRVAALSASPTLSATSYGRTLASTEVASPCARPACKITVGRGVEQGILCATCRRTYCLRHRLQEEHDCASLPAFGPASAAARAQAELEKSKVGALTALGKLRAWGSAKKEEAATRILPKPKPSSAAARMVAVNGLKKTAKGDEKVTAEKRVYLFVEAEAATTRSKLPKGHFFYSRDWVVGKVLDAAAKSLSVENVNNTGLGEKEKLRVFHVEGGRLLEFGEKLGDVLVSGNTIVLLRGVGPAVPDLIDLTAA